MSKFEQIQADVKAAIAVNNTSALPELIEELDALRTPKAIALAHSTRSQHYALRNNFPLALEEMQRALVIREEIGDLSGVASAIGNIGQFHFKLGNYPSAQDYFSRSLAAFEKLEDQEGAARVKANSADLLAFTGNYKAALELYHQVMVVFEKQGALDQLAVVLGNMGSVYRATGNFPEAIDYLHRALAICKKTGDRRSEAVTIANIGSVSQMTGDYPLALKLFHQAQAISEEQGDAYGVIASTGFIGNVHSASGNLTLALENYERALKMSTELDFAEGISLFTGNVGHVHNLSGNYTTALEYFNRALPWHKEMEDLTGVANDTINICSVLIATGQFTEANTLLGELDSIPIESPNLVVEREQLRAALQEHNGEMDKARITLHAGLEHSVKHGIIECQTSTLKLLRDFAQRSNDFASYIKFNDEFNRINEETNGKDTATKLAIQEKQREIDATAREVEKYMSVLHSTLPKSVADRVARGEVVNDQFDNAAVMFIDVVSFTTNSSELPATEVVSLLQNMFTSFDSICAKHSVTKIKTIGDAYMAVAFPTVVEKLASSNSSAERTQGDVIEHHYKLASAALEISRSEFTWSHNNSPVQFRIGLHSGPVVAGILGTERMQYDVWGDTVNVASRMESSGEPGRIHVSNVFTASFETPTFASSDASNHIAPFKFTPRGEVEIKGKGSMKTCWLEGE